MRVPFLLYSPRNSERLHKLVYPLPWTSLISWTGAGKTCASIAITEGIKTAREVIIMTPASLRANYIHELKVCGDSLYKQNQYWEFVKSPSDEASKAHLENTLGLPPGYIGKREGIWLVDVRREPNYNTLTDEQQISLNNQIDTMIGEKYQFISYNGLRESHLDILTQGGETRNPFDGKVVVIDEAHNFISRIVNKLATKKNSLSVKLYEFLLSAENCRVVMLTGTPVINYPNELGVLFNILRGYIKSFIFNLQIRTKRRINQQAMNRIFKSDNISDFVEYSSSSKTLTLTRNPFGFVSRYQREIYKGVSIDAEGNVDNTTFVKRVRALLNTNDIGVTKVTEQVWKALPDTLEGFKVMFIDPKTGKVKNTNLFKRRIVGLTSYFRSAREELMPSFDIEKDFTVELVPMSDFQFGIYELARSKERDMEKNNKKRQNKGQANTEGLYTNTVSTYRIFSRAFCNFVFPREIGRPLPREDKDISQTVAVADEDTLDSISVAERLANIDGRYEPSDEEGLHKQTQSTIDTSYERRIREALKALQQNAGTYLSPEGLRTYSPKFLEILKNLEAESNSGLQLVYSQFRTLGGDWYFQIGIRREWLCPI